MPYSYPSHVPRVAKHWSETERRICAEVAGREYSKSGDDRKATFACIGAVKNHRKKYKALYKQGSKQDKFDKQSEENSKKLQHLVELLYAGEIVLSEFDNRFRSELKDIYLKTMLLGRGNQEINEVDLATLQKQLDKQYAYLDDFVKDLSTGRYSQQKALWRAGLYGTPYAAFVYYDTPPDVANLMPVMPGLDCLGLGYCGCGLSISYDDEGTAYVDWVLDPLKEHCVLCIAHAEASPYIFTAEELVSGKRRNG